MLFDERFVKAKLKALCCNMYISHLTSPQSRRSRCSIKKNGYDGEFGNLSVGRLCVLLAEPSRDCQDQAMGNNEVYRNRITIRDDQSMSHEQRIGTNTYPRRDWWTNHVNDWFRVPSRCGISRDGKKVVFPE